MTPFTLERHQVWIYLVTIIFGLGLGMLLVLLVPCTDWFITFTRLGANWLFTVLDQSANIIYL